MKRVLFLFFILYAFNFKAQEDEEFIFIQRNFNNPFRIVLFNDALFLSKKPIQFKLWEEGFLTIDDFQSTDYPEKDNLSLLKTGFLKYYYAFVPFKLKIKSRDTIFFYTKVYLLIDKSQSWISKEVNVIQTLNYFNGLYDLLQLYAKLFEYEANRFFPNVYGIQRVNKQLKRDIEKFKEETDEGKNSIELARKSDSIKEKLSQIKSPHLPPIIFSPFLLGFNISYQANIPLLSQVLQYYQMMNGINLSFYISHRKNYFNIFFGYASSKLMTNYISETNNLLYQKGNIIGFGNYGIGYERSIIDNKRWRLTPFVGIGGSNLNINYYPNSSQTNDRSKDLKINSIYYCGGISFVLLFRKYLYTPGNYQYLFYNVLVYNYGLNLKLYISYSNFNPTFKNFLINFSLGFNLLETRKGKFVDNKNALIID